MMLREWNIQDEQLHCFVRDGGSNMVRAMHVADIPDDCVTRWNSTFHMIERMLKIKDSICLYASKHNIPQISPEEYKLKFFDEINKEQVQSELIHLLTIHNLNVASGVSDDEASGASAAKKARVESNPMHEEPSTSFQILPSTQSVHSNLVDMLTNRSDSEEETENDDSNSNLMIWIILISEYNKENRLKLDDDPLL
ncbi:hypothetical protein evm_013812 [Chilo suppressalis]|nr:hypothetical protein evm_013812 [Chilo suppressalis]